MSKHTRRSNLMRSIQRGSYTDIYKKEMLAEKKKKANLALQIQRVGRKW